MADGGESKCPVSGNTGKCPIKGSGGEIEHKGSGCPVSPRNIYKFFTGIDTNVSDLEKSTYKSAHQYNVYSEVIDPTNQMPVNPKNNLPAENQAIPISTTRVKSNIPKAGTDDNADGSSQTWLYPSPQMFWNSLVRKDKVEGAKEEDMEMVVAVHNNMNERTWNEVMKWEELKGKGAYLGGPPKLLRFQGKPDDLSPKARLKMLFGHPAPFDRHDWWVDQGGRINRYIIDYYHDISSSSQDNKPSTMSDFNSMKSIKIDVRPAYDNFFGFYGRLFVMPFKRLTNMTTFSPLPFFAAKQMTEGENKQKEKLRLQWKEIESKCLSAKEAMKICSSEEECGAAAITLQRCTAAVVCPDVVQAFDAAIAATKAKSPEHLDDSDIHTAFKKITGCLENFEIDCRTMK